VAQAVVVIRQLLQRDPALQPIVKNMVGCVFLICLVVLLRFYFPVLVPCPCCGTWLV
jgi:hypothetical protein